MTYERLQPRDKTLLGVVVVLIAAAAWFTVRNYEAAFPQASIDLKYSKGEITSMAEEILHQRGFSTEGYRNLTLFDSDRGARLFLEREIGLRDANRLMEREVSVWRWRARWFKPPQEEELLVYLSPDGRLVGFDHVVPEAREGARLDQEAALSLASEYLAERTELPHRLIEEQLRERPNRYDYVFTWERNGFRAKDATYRRTVVIQGDEVGQYFERLHVPERWEREYAALRSSNELYTRIAQVFFVLLGLAAVGLLIRALHRHEVRWRPLVIICAVAGVVATCNEWNLLPFYIDSMPTSSPYYEMLLVGVLQGLGAGVGYFFYIILAAAPGEPLYRAGQPERLSLSHALSGMGTRTREFFRSTVAGYGFVAFHLVFLVAFYLVSTRFGAWSPQDVGYSDLLSTAAPWLYPLAIGVLASSSEEFWFRLLAVPLLKRYTGSTWIAVLLPAFVWGFLHANYPQQPGFIRGVEVGLIGVGAGFLLLRFGILATLIWHYTIDALLVSTILFESDSPYFWGSGILVTGAVLIPLGISLFHYRRNGGFVSDPKMLNANVPAPPPIVRTEEEEAEPEPVRPVWRARWLYLASVVALVIGALVNPTRFGDFIDLRVSAVEAAAAADLALQKKSVAPGDWKRSMLFISNLDTAEFEYIRRVSGVVAANEVVRDREFHGVWMVRYLQPLEQEEWRVYVDQKGRVYRSDHLVEETAPGANLTPEEAQELAEGELNHRLRISEYRLVDSREEKREQRTDHEFVWEDKNFRIGEATARLSLTVVGDEISQYRKHLKLPEEWLREFHKPRWQQYITSAIGGAIGLPLLLIFVRRIGSRREGRRNRYHWRAYALAGILAAGASAADAANQWANMLVSYSTAEPLENYVVEWLLGHLTTMLLTGLGFFALVMAGDLLLQMAIGNRTPTTPTLVRTLSVTALLWGLFRILGYVGLAVPGDRWDLSLWSIPEPASSFPALSVLTGSLMVAVALVPLLVVVGSAAYHYLMNRTGATLLTVVVALVALSRSASSAQWSFHIAELAVLLFLAVFLLRTCGIDLAGFTVAVFWLMAIGLGSQLAAQPEQYLQWNGFAALVAAAMAGVAFLRFARGRA